jgi:PAS domain S-box-containing protein
MIKITQALLNLIYHRLFKYFPARVYWVDHHLKYIGCNKLHYKFLGLSSEKNLVGKNFQQIASQIGECIDEKITSHKKYVITLEKKYRLKNHQIITYRIIQITFWNITVFFEEELSQHFKYIAELEEKCAHLQHVREKSDAYLDNVIKIVPASIYWKDIHSVILGSNLFHTKLAGFINPEDVIGKTEYDFVWKNQAESIIENDKKIMELGIGLRLQETAKLEDGKVHTFLTSKEPLRDKNNKIIGIIGISIDITDQKLAEERANKAEAAELVAHAKADSEEEMRKMIMVLVGDIVHDLRTPIATIRTTAQLLSTIFPNLLQILEDAKQLGSNKVDILSKKELNSLYNGTFVKALENSVSMMDDFINSTLKELTNAQKAQSELTSIDLTRCSSRRILENTLDAYPFEPGIKVYQNTSYDFDLMGNSILIMKILFNLLRNAEEQILHQGKGEITISTRSVDRKNLISVKDTAGGIAPEVIDNIFTGYFTTKKQGTGIGLTFCREIMKSFGGELTCNNVYGESVEFILEFPRVDE